MKSGLPHHENSHRYESIFCVFMLAVAFLYRDNAHLVYPHILYLFAGLLAFNLVAGWLLRHRAMRAEVAAFIVIGNCALITSILAHSGGPDSNLWVLYLLPIYTVCILLEGFQLVLIVTGIVSFNAVFHWLAGNRALDPTMMFNLSLKSGLFVFAAAATWRMARKDRISRDKIEGHRAEMERMVLRLQTARDNANDDTRRMADIGQVASGIAHDIAGPLTVIIGSVRMLLEDDGAAPFRKDLERIHRAAQLCETISSSVLSFARSQDVQMKSCDLRRVVESALQIYEPMLVERGITIDRAYDPDVPSVTGMAAQLERVVLNLLSNAKAAMPAGGRLRIGVSSEMARPFSPCWAQITVEDTGPGISPEAFAKIFKPFNTTKAPGEGTGIGLYLCRQIAVDHKGRLHVENRAEGGARFVLSIPCAAVESVFHTEARAA